MGRCAALGRNRVEEDFAPRPPARRGRTPWSATGGARRTRRAPSWARAAASPTGRDARCCRPSPITCRLSTGAPAASSSASASALASKASKRRRLARLPAARPLVAGQQRRRASAARRRPDSAGRSRTGGCCRRRDAALRCGRGEQAGQQRRAASTFISSLIGLASVHAPPPNGAASRLADEAPGHRFVEPARRRGAAQPALEHLRRRRGRLARRPVRGSGVEGIASKPVDAR